MKVAITALLISILGSCLMLYAQTPTPPPSTIAASPGPGKLDPAPIAAAFLQEATWTAWADASITKLGQGQAANEATLKLLTDQTIAVNVLKTQVAGQEAKIIQLEAAIKALQLKTTAAGTTLATP
jgi:hypothetical protein